MNCRDEREKLIWQGQVTQYICLSHLEAWQDLPHIEIKAHWKYCSVSLFCPTVLILICRNSYKTKEINCIKYLSVSNFVLAFIVNWKSSSQPCTDSALIIIIIGLQENAYFYNVGYHTFYIYLFIYFPVSCSFSFLWIHTHKFLYLQPGNNICFTCGKSREIRWNQWQMGTGE